MRSLVAFVPVLMLAFATAALAEGTTRVQQSTGAVQTYQHVRITLSGKTLWLRSPDGKDRLQIVSAACTYVRDMERCLPYKVFLHKAQATHEIAIERGVFYANLTGESHSLSHSSQQVPAHSVLMFLHTMRGTYVTVRGRVDAVDVK